MAWSTPKTWVAGAPLPASELNQYVRDQFAFLHDKGGDLASAAALPAPTTQYHVVTGTTTITSIPILAAGARLILSFAAACMVTSGGNLALHGPFAAAAGDTLMLVSDGVNWHEVSPNERQIDYAPFAAAVTGITATTEGAATVVVAGSSIVYDANRVRLEFYAPYTDGSPSTVGVHIVFLRDATVIGQAQQISGGFCYATVFDTPSAGTPHVYSVKAFTDSGQTLNIRAGAGGAGALVAGFLRQERG